MITIHPVPALKDNYVWAIVNDETKKAVIVDPGEADPVINFLSKNNLQLKLILLTHHHGDHTDGVKGLCEHFQKKEFAFGPGLSDTDFIIMDHFPLRFNAISIPGHTLDHTAYYTNGGHLFSGDTLFSAGCGRVFEGTMEQMYGSLQKLASLPDETKVYCGHEYTEKNLRFAQTVEPANAAISKKLEEVHKLRAQNQATLPSTIGLEKEINPFLRCQVPEVVAAAEKFAGQHLSNPVEVFAAIRKWKDGF